MQLIRDALARYFLRRVDIVGWKPDYVIGRVGEGVYLYRWWVIPRNKLFNIYLHHFVGSDEDKALHDHPWINCSWVLRGRYFEQTIAAGGVQHSEELREGGLKFRWPRSAHRVQLPPGETCWTLFFTGPVVRTWGFHCPKQWVPWQEFTVPNKPGEVGKGCP